MLSRRDLVGKLAAGTAAVCVAGVAGKSLAATHSDANAGTGNPPSGDAPAPFAWNEPVVDAGAPATLSAPGAVGAVASAGDGLDGCAWLARGRFDRRGGRLVRADAGERARPLRIACTCAATTGVRRDWCTRSVSTCVVMNGGEGDLPTEEGLAQAVAEVAHVLAANENDRQHEPWSRACCRTRNACACSRVIGPIALEVVVAEASSTQAIAPRLRAGAGPASRSRWTRASIRSRRSTVRATCSSTGASSTCRDRSAGRDRRALDGARVGDARRARCAGRRVRQRAAVAGDAAAPVAGDGAHSRVLHGRGAARGGVGAVGRRSAGRAGVGRAAGGSARDHGSVGGEARRRSRTRPSRRRSPE